MKGFKKTHQINIKMIRDDFELTKKKFGLGEFNAIATLKYNPEAFKVMSDGSIVGSIDDQTIRIWADEKKIY
ncbi:MAG: hypothetical protein ACI8P9_004428 [Parasphingorhabdus sp.]|jgi:hypothetical protein